MSKGRRLLGWVGIAVPCLLPLAACSEFDDPPVVTVGTGDLTLSDLRRAHADLDTADRPPLESREERSAFVDMVVQRTILARHGRTLAPGSPSEDLEREGRAILVQRLRTLEGGEESPSQEQVEEAYRWMAIRHHVERIHFPSEEARQAAREAIDAGADPADAVRGAGGMSEGSGGWVHWSQFADPIVDAAIGAPVGGIGVPLLAGPPFLLVRVLERETVPQPPLEEIRAQITRGLRVRRQAERVEELAQRLRTEGGVRFHGDVIDLLARRTSEAILDPEGTDFGREWALPRLQPGEEDLVVAEWGDGRRWTTMDYLGTLEELSPSHRPRVSVRAAIQLSCVRGVTRELFLEEARRRRLDEEWWAAKAIRKSRADWLVKLAQREIQAAARVDPAEAESIAARLQTAQPDLFRREARARVFWFEFSTREAAVAELERTRRAGGARNRLREVLDAESVLPGGYRVLWLTSSTLESSGLERAVLAREAGAMSGPYEFRDQWVLVERLELEPERILTSDEVLADVQERIRRGGDPQAVARWVEVRREEIGVTVDEDALDALAPGV